MQITAYHEAAHAVAAWACGIQVSEVSVERDENGLGYTRLSFTPEQKEALGRKDPSLLWQLVLFGLAGMAGDHGHWRRARPGPSNEVLRGDFRDQQQVRQRLEMLGYNQPTDFDACLGSATKFFSRDEVWCVVDELALRLMNSKKLGRHHLAEFAAKTPKIDAAFWDFVERAIDHFRRGA